MSRKPPFSITVHFRNHADWKLNISMPDFNHTGNAKKLRRAVCKELEQKGMGDWKPYMQRIEVK